MAGLLRVVVLLLLPLLPLPSSAAAGERYEVQNSFGGCRHRVCVFWELISHVDMRHGKSRTVNDKCSHHFPVLGWWVQSDCLMWGTPETDCVDLSFVTPTWIMEASESLTGFYSRLLCRESTGSCSL